MKKFAVPLLILVVLVGCSTEGDIKIINRTDHNLYLSLEGNDYILEGSETTDPTMTISVDTGKQFLFYIEDYIEVDMHLEGETFMMRDAINGIPIDEYFTETTLQVKPKETLNVYCDPTHAGVKLINNFSENVIDLAYYTDDTDTLVSIIDLPVEPGDSTWSRLKATTEYDSITYSFIVEFENGYIDSSYINIDDLIIDEQLRMEFGL
ncbi:MAG: hypothetical protein P9L97_05100 [Candidatus Tenebribacter davisii]|jgi:hypothetical protein|nr:hypothetical protein [Candidatus Tenebribacter davisii]